jgi:hypothetical protein
MLARQVLLWLELLQPLSVVLQEITGDYFYFSLGYLPFPHSELEGEQVGILKTILLRNSTYNKLHILSK